MFRKEKNCLANKSDDLLSYGSCIKLQNAKWVPLKILVANIAFSKIIVTLSLHIVAMKMKGNGKNLQPVVKTSPIGVSWKQIKDTEYIFT